MNPPDLLHVWDQAKAARRGQLALVLLTGLGGAATKTDAAILPVGVRDGGLLAGRRRLFGPRMDLLAACPHCAERLEFSLDSTALESSAIAVAWPVELAVGSITVVCRQPTTADVAAALDNAADMATARRRLFESCTISASCEGRKMAVEALDEDVAVAVAAAMTDLDPLADLRVVLTCPGCRNVWDALIDPPQLLWSALNAWGVAELSEIAALAHRFAWSERDILAMSPVRRRSYLDMLS